MREINLVHVPKTAGTSLRNAIHEQRILSDSGHYMFVPFYGNPIADQSEQVTNAEFNAIEIEALNSYRSKQFDIFLSSHKHADYLWGKFHPSSFVSVVRDPLRQAISEYNHIKKLYNYPGSIFDHFELNSNRQYKYFDKIGVDKLGFIGTQDRVSQWSSMLSSYLDLEIVLRKDNALDYTREARDIVYDADVRSAFKKRYSKDIELYAHISENWERYARSSPFDDRSESRVHSFRIDKYLVLHGWVSNSGRSLTTVRVYTKDGSLLKSATADEFRPDLFGSEIVSHGVAGFSIDLSDERAEGLSSVVMSTNGFREEIDLQETPSRETLP